MKAAFINAKEAGSGLKMDPHHELARKALGFAVDVGTYFRNSGGDQKAYIFSCKSKAQSKV